MVSFGGERAARARGLPRRAGAVYSTPSSRFVEGTHARGAAGRAARDRRAPAIPRRAQRRARRDPHASRRRRHRREARRLAPAAQRRALRRRAAHASRSASRAACAGSATTRPCRRRRARRDRDQPARTCGGTGGTRRCDTLLHEMVHQWQDETRRSRSTTAPTSGEGARGRDRAAPGATCARARDAARRVA